MEGPCVHISYFDTVTLSTYKNFKIKGIGEIFRTSGPNWFQSTRKD